MGSDSEFQQDGVSRLVSEVLAGRLTRRQLITRAAMAGLSVTAIGQVLAACGSSTSGGGSSPAAGSSPSYGGTLNVSFEGEPTGLDPSVAWELESWSILHCVYNQMLTYVAGPGPAVVTTDLATEVPSVANGGVTNDGKTWTFHLRPGVMFHPPVSREVTAEDVKWSMERMLNPKLSPRAPAGYMYTSIVGVDDLAAGKATHAKGIKAIDKYTVQIDLTQPDYVFAFVMALPFTAVLPKEWVAKFSYAQIARHPLGTGPFIFDHWTANQEIVIKKNPDYFIKGLPLRRRAALRVRGELADRSAAARGRQDRRAGQRHAVGAVRADDEQPHLEEPDHGRRHGRLVLHLHERHGEAVRQPAGAPGDQLRGRYVQDREAALRSGAAAQPDLPGRHDRPRRRRDVLLVRPREGQEPAVAGRLPERLLGHLLSPQRRPHAEARREHPERPVGGRHQGVSSSSSPSHPTGL